MTVTELIAALQALPDHTLPVRRVDTEEPESDIEHVEVASDEVWPPVGDERVMEVFVRLS